MLNYKYIHKYKCIHILIYHTMYYLVCVCMCVYIYIYIYGLPWWLSGKEPTCQGRVLSLGWEDLLEKEMATHPSILSWEIPWTEETGVLQSMGSQKSWT